MVWNFDSRTISNSKIQIETLEKRHFGEVCDAMIPDPDGWYSIMFGLNSPTAYQKEFDDADDYRKKKYGMGFAIRDIASSQICGISFFLKMDEENRSLEIGTTNIAPRFRRTYANTATKLLMLEYAFENLHCIRSLFGLMKRI